MIKKLWNAVKGYAKDGMFYIFGSSVLAQVGALISSMVVVRRLPKADYGHYVSANNLYTYCSIFIGLGLAAAMLQFCSEKITEERRNAIYRHSLKKGSLANILVSIAILILALVKYLAGDGRVAYYLTAMCALPFAVYLNNYLQMVLRIKLKNKEFSYVNITYSVVMLGGSIAFTILFGIIGLVIALYAANAMAAVVSLILLKKEKFFPEVFGGKNLPRLENAKEINTYAVICAFTSFASSVLMLLDVTCLDILIGDKVILADYKVAATIPAACHFVPSCLITFFYPRMVKAFSEGRTAGKAITKTLFKVFALVNGAVYLVLALGAPLIIRLIFGAKYMNVIPIFQVLSFNYFVYCIWSLLGNILAVTKKVKAKLLFCVLSGILNIGLNVLMIYLWGSIGAAIATTCVTIIIVITELLYVRGIFRKMKDMT